MIDHKTLKNESERSVFIILEFHVTFSSFSESKCTFFFKMIIIQKINYFIIHLKSLKIIFSKYQLPFRDAISIINRNVLYTI